MPIHFLLASSPLLSSKLLMGDRRRDSCCSDCKWFPIVWMSLFILVILSHAVSIAGDETREPLYQEILKDEAIFRLKELGKISDSNGYLQRTFMSPASLTASNLILSWMQDAGLKTWIDQMGNVHGRAESTNTTAEALLIGSHLDTVIDAGIFDGALGIISAISVLKVLKVSGKLDEIQRPVEVIAFSDEEGVRFQTTFLGSAALAGTLPSSVLTISDKSGLTVQDALKESSFEGTEESFIQLKYNPQDIWGYVEVHIEQGPVLESLDLPLGVVSGIAGQTRLRITVKGTQGHAGTVPMTLRHDPMPAAAELIVLLESFCKHPKHFLTFEGHNRALIEDAAGSLVCTVGEISTWPSASNVIPGEVTFSVDIRTMDDKMREIVISEFSHRMYQICEQRSVSCAVERKHNAEAVHCDRGLSSQLKVAAKSALEKMSLNIQEEMPTMMSGAGHDAMALSQLTKVGMLFVRCREGVSHSPAEHVLDDDVWAAGLALLTFVQANVLIES